MIRTSYDAGDAGVCVEGSSISCGVNQIDGVAYIENQGMAEEFMYEFVDSINRSKVFPFYLFSDTVKKSGARKLVKFIEDNKLGTVLQSKTEINPNTGNKIEVFIWSPDTINLLKWYNNEMQSLLKRRGY